MKLLIIKHFLLSTVSQNFWANFVSLISEEKLFKSFYQVCQFYVSVRLLVCSLSVWTLKCHSYILKASWQFTSILFCNFTLCVQKFKQVKVLLLINTWAKFHHYIIQIKLQCQPFSLSQGHIQNSFKPVQFLVTELNLHF